MDCTVLMLASLNISCPACLLASFAGRGRRINKQPYLARLRGHRLDEVHPPRWLPWSRLMIRFRVLLTIKQTRVGAGPCSCSVTGFVETASSNGGLSPKEKRPLAAPFSGVQYESSPPPCRAKTPGFASRILQVTSNLARSMSGPAPGLPPGTLIHDSGAGGRLFPIP